MFSNFDIVDTLVRKHQLCINKWRERCGDNVLTCLKITIVLTKSLSVEEIENLRMHALEGAFTEYCEYWFTLMLKLENSRRTWSWIRGTRAKPFSIKNQDITQILPCTSASPAQAAAVSFADSHSFLASTSHVWRHGTRDTCCCQQGRDHSHQSPLTRRKDCSCETFLQFYF